MTVLDKEPANNLIEDNNGSSVASKQSAATNLTKCELEETIEYLRDYSAMLRAEYRKDYDEVDFTLDPKIKNIIERIKSILDGTAIEKENYIFWWEGNGWSIGRESNPLFIKISSQKSGQYLHSLLSIFPSYDSTRQLKDIEALTFSCKVDIDLGIAPDIISQYAHPPSFRPEENIETAATANDIPDVCISDVDMSDVNNIDDTAQDYEVPQEEEEEEDIVAEARKADELGEDYTPNEVNTEDEEEDIEFGFGDDQYHEDDIPAGVRENGSDVSKLIVGDGLAIKKSDSLDNPDLSKGMREQYETERDKLKNELEIAEATGDGEMITMINEQIDELNSVLGRKRVDEKHQSEANRTRDRMRTGINKTLSDIRKTGEEGKELAAFIKQRLILGDPLSYNPKQGDPVWILQKPK